MPHTVHAKIRMCTKASQSAYSTNRFFTNVYGHTAPYDFPAAGGQEQIPFKRQGPMSIAF